VVAHTHTHTRGRSTGGKEGNGARQERAIEEARLGQKRRELGWDDPIACITHCVCVCVCVACLLWEEGRFAFSE